MSFLRSPITTGPVRPSVLTGIVSYQSITLFLCFCFCLYLYFSFLSLVTTVLPCPLELTGGLLTNHQCFHLWTTKTYKHKNNRSSIACSAIA